MIKVLPLNDYIVSDENINIMIIKKPKRRYRNIIKAFYKTRRNNK